MAKLSKAHRVISKVFVLELLISNLNTKFLNMFHTRKKMKK